MFFLIMRPPPPRSTLFPYTTLFRSLGVNLSKRTAEQIVADASVDFDSFYRERSLRLAPDSGPLLIASVDGKGVPMVKSRSEEHTSELQSHSDLVCRLLLEKKK